MRVRQETPAWKEVVSRYLEVGNQQYPLEVPLRPDGALVVSDKAELKVFWHIFVRRCYRLPRHCETIVDAGANVGVFATWAAREYRSSRILCLEPSPGTFASLRENIRRNGLEERVRPIQCALAAESGERLLNVDLESPYRNLVLTGDGTVGRTIAVPCMSLTDLFRQERFETLDLLKMDIEGSEWEVLLSTSNAVLSRIRCLLLEYHEVNASLGYAPETLFAHLKASGLEITYREEDTRRTGLAFLENRKPAVA
jgi:FkbM family methyltransferase